MREVRALAVVVLVLGTVAASPIIIRHDRADGEYRALGERFADLHVELRVPLRDGTPGPVGNGLGTLIAPTWVLTAAHVVRSFAPGHPDNRVTGQHVVTVNGAEHRVAEVFLHPDYVRRPSSANDIALVRLADPVANHRYAEAYRERDEVGREVVWVGTGDFGTGRTGPTTRDRTLRGATNRVERADDLRLFFKFDSPESGAATELEGISGPGDSGNGALMERNGRVYIVGVGCCQSHDGTEGLYGVTEIYPRVSSYAAWIDEVMSGSR
jgi:hypothetical protein